MGAMGGVDDIVGELERVIAELTDRHFPLARVRKRSNDAPWITRYFQRLWKRKIQIYKKGGRSDRCWETDRIFQEIIQESREAFIEKMLEEGNSGRSFYLATKKLSIAAFTPQWSAQDLFVGK